MESGEDKIARYRKLLHRDPPTVTRRSLEWLLVNAAREHAGLRPLVPSGSYLSAPPLMLLADEAVEEAIEAQGAQFGAIQIYAAAQDQLVMLTQRNFSSAFLDHFACFSPDGRTACSRAVKSGERVVIEDIEQDSLFRPHVPSARAAGFRAVQSTPLKSGARVIGIISTHFAAPRKFSKAELGRMNAHARRVSSRLAQALN